MKSAVTPRKRGWPAGSRSGTRRRGATWPGRVMRVPAVQPDEAPEVDPRATRGERRDEQRPRQRARRSAAARPGARAGATPIPSASAVHAQARYMIASYQSGTRGGSRQVDEVGQQVRRVRQEEQPQPPRRAPTLDPRPSAAVGVVEPRARTRRAARRGRGSRRGSGGVGVPLQRIRATTSATQNAAREHRASRARPVAGGSSAHHRA